MRRQGIFLHTNKYRNCVFWFWTPNIKKKESFISLGPARRISEKSLFQFPIQISYDAPQFNVICDTIKHKRRSKNRMHLSVDKFSILSAYQLCCLLYCIIRILKIATKNDILEIFKVIFGKNRYSFQRVLMALSVLIGSGYVRTAGPFGHLRSQTHKGDSVGGVDVIQAAQRSSHDPTPL